MLFNFLKFCNYMQYQDKCHQLTHQLTKSTVKQTVLLKKRTLGCKPAVYESRDEGSKDEWVLFCILHSVKKHLVSVTKRKAVYSNRKIKNSKSMFTSFLIQRD